MITKKGLQERLEAENIKVNIIAFEVTDEYMWFAFSFDETHTELEREDALVADTEDDALIDWLNDDDEECYAEAVSCIKCSSLNPHASK